MQYNFKKTGRTISLHRDVDPKFICPEDRAIVITKKEDKFTGVVRGNDFLSLRHKILKACV